MARPSLGPRVDWKVSIPAELARKFELLFYDKTTRKVNYGARSELVRRLLQQYWDNLPSERRDEALQPRGQA